MTSGPCLNFSFSGGSCPGPGLAVFAPANRLVVVVGVADVVRLRLKTREVLPKYLEARRL